MDNKKIFFDVIGYWENRYKGGGDSGFGSHDERSVTFKNEYVNSIIEKYKIKTIIELGCGDGNQLGGFKGYDKYHGFDISKSVIERCKGIYLNQDDKEFANNIDDFKIKDFDLSLSLDVTYHLVNLDMFEEYVANMFDLSNLVCFFTTDFNSVYEGKHGLHRKITEHINEHYPDYKLIDKKKYLESKDDTLSFFLYKKIEKDG